KRVCRVAGLLSQGKAKRWFVKSSFCCFLPSCWLGVPPRRDFSRPWETNTGIRFQCSHRKSRRTCSFAMTNSSYSSGWTTRVSGFSSRISLPRTCGLTGQMHQSGSTMHIPPFGIYRRSTIRQRIYRPASSFRRSESSVMQSSRGGTHILTVPSGASTTCFRQQMRIRGRLGSTSGVERLSPCQLASPSATSTQAAAECGGLDHRCRSRDWFPCRPALRDGG
ncbi:MAG: hypothetical protein HW389_1854, partial [Bacteroidetes bacterium]|nr:hypothetical protein [Bacteroidota bacterium]